MEEGLVTEEWQISVDGELKEGEQLFVDDFRFKTIGVPVPTVPSDRSFDQESPPSQGLAVSQTLGLVFVAHSQGFFVVRMDDAVQLAKNYVESFKGSFLQERSIVDVLLGHVYILALSHDSSLLAVCAGDEVHIFSTSSLLMKESIPLDSSPFGSSNHVKDLQWNKNGGNSYLLLSNEGFLYHGNADGRHKVVADSVMAFDWSVRNSFVAIVQETRVGILSSDFRRKGQLLLPFQVHGDDDSVTKVDSIKWVRCDSIVLGCLQVTKDGVDIDYHIAVVTLEESQNVEGSPEPAVAFFTSFFSSYCESALQRGRGPFLFTNYMEIWGLAITSNRKIVDEHISLIGWLKDSSIQVAVISPKVDLLKATLPSQDNDDDNLIVGLCVDEKFNDGKFEVLVGDESKELSPYAILLCLTVDGKLTLFRLARSSETISLYSGSGVQIAELFPSHESEYAASKSSNHVSAKLLASQESHNDSAASSKFGTERVGIHELLSQPENEKKRVAAVIKAEKSTPQIVVEKAVSNQELRTSSMRSEKLDLSSSLHPFSSSPQNDALPAVPETRELKTSTLRSEKLDLSSRGFSGSSRDASPAMFEQKGQPRSDVRENLQTPRMKQDMDFPGEFQNIREMAEQLDYILANIERQSMSGDTLPTFQKSSVIEIEEGMRLLSRACIKWTHMVIKQQELICNLQDQATQVKQLLVHVKDDVKQAADSRNWDLRKRQKLPLELERQRQRFLKANQVLIKQLSELERHFNMLELSKFGDLDIQSKRRPVKNDLVRAKQAFYSLQDTVNSQLAVAEQLSECLSEQMAALNIVPHSKQKHGMTKELFDSIGLQYSGERYQSPKLGSSKPTSSPIRASPLPSTANKHLTKGEATSREQKPVSTRRRKDSLDERWLQFEPPKTIVRRILEETSKIHGEKIPVVSRRKAVGSQLEQDFLSSAVGKDQTLQMVSCVPSSSKSPSSIIEETGSLKEKHIGQQTTAMTRLRQDFASMPREFSVEVLQPDNQFSRLQSKEPSRITRSPLLDESSTSAATKGRMSNWDDGDRKMLLSGTSNASSSSSKPFSTSFSEPQTSFTLSSGFNPNSGQSQSPLHGASSGNLELDSAAVTKTATSLPSFPLAGFTSISSATVTSSHVSLSTSNIPSKDQSLQSSPPVDDPSVLNSTQNRKAPSAGLFGGSKVVASSTSGFTFTPESKGSTLPVSTSFLPASLLTKKSSDSVTSSSMPAYSASPSPIFSASSSPILPPSNLLSSKPDLTTFSSSITTSTLSKTVHASSAPSPVSSTVQLDVPKELSSSAAFPELRTSAALPSLSSDTHQPVSTSSSATSMSQTAQSQEQSLSSSSPAKSQQPLSTLSSLSSASLSWASQSFSSQAELSKPAIAIKKESAPPSSSLTASMTGFSFGSQPAQTSTPTFNFSSSPSVAPLSSENAIVSSTAVNEVMDSSTNEDEDDMEEEAPELSASLNFGALGSFGLGSINSNAQKPNLFGGSFSGSPQTSAAFSMSVPPGELFRPASFSLPSAEASQASSSNAFSVALGGATGSSPVKSGFGQPAQIGAGQQALGSVLGSFGQSRQIGGGLPGAGFASPGTFGSGFAASGSGAPLPPGAASAGGGFAAAASAGGGFAGAASAGGGFAGVAGNSGAGGFQAFGSKPATVCFGSFAGTNAPGSSNPLFTQMRK